VDRQLVDAIDAAETNENALLIAPIRIIVAWLRMLLWLISVA
jgi:hypothetical protein